MRQNTFLVAAVALGCLTLGLVETLQLYFGDAGPGRGEWSLALARVLPSWLILAALAPLPVWASARWPFRGRAWRVPLLAHVAVAIPFALVHLALTAFVGALRPGALLGAWDGLAWLLSRYFVYDLVCYAAFVGGVHALRYRRALGRLEREAATVLEELKLARLRALDGQLHPHFVFNTLAAITGLAHRGDQRQVVDTLTAFSELLHASLGAGSPRMVTLEREVELLRSYVAIHQARFGDRIAVDWDLAPGTSELLVPCLVLQPLVENAVGHGVARNPAGGRVSVSSRTDGRALLLEVADSGAGGDPPPPDTPGSGIGLAATRSRLHELFGGEARLEFVERGPEGTVVRLTLPAERERPVPLRRLGVAG